MALFQGVPTEQRRPRPRLMFEPVDQKLVRANPNFIRRSGGASTQWMMNIWDLVPDPTDPRHLCYHVRVTFHPMAGVWTGWWIVVDLNVNDSLRRILPTETEALQVFQAIQPYTTKKTLHNRGFRTW